jgi:hypothetical protein
MIRSRRCYNLAALAESEDPADLAQSHRIGSSVGIRIKPPYNFHVKINSKLNQVVSPIPLFPLKELMAGYRIKP